MTHFPCSIFVILCICVGLHVKERETWGTVSTKRKRHKSCSIGTKGDYHSYCAPGIDCAHKNLTKFIHHFNVLRITIHDWSYCRSTYLNWTSLVDVVLSFCPICVEVHFQTVSKWTYFRQYTQFQRYRKMLFLTQTQFVFLDSSIISI